MGVAAIGAVSMVGAFLGPLAWGVTVDRAGGFQTGLFALVVPYVLAAGVFFVLRHTTRTAPAFGPAIPATVE